MKSDLWELELVERWEKLGSFCEFLIQGSIGWQLIFIPIVDSLMKLFPRLNGEPQTASTRLGIVCGYRRREI